MRIREMVGGSLMTGEAHSGPQMEYATMEHVLPCGGVMREVVLRSVETAAPDASPEAPPAEPEAPADAAG